MTNKEKFLDLVSKKDAGIIERNRERIRNRAMLQQSQKIALKVLMKLDDLGWTQKDLAKKMEVSPQQISKIVSGKENLTLKTQIKLQEALDLPVLASYYEDKLETLINTLQENFKINLEVQESQKVSNTDIITKQGEYIEIDNLTDNFKGKTKFEFAA